MIDFDDLEERLRGRADGDDGLYADALDAIIGLRDTESSLRGALRLLRRQKDAEIARLRSEPPTEAGEQEPVAWKWRERIYERPWGRWKVSLERPSDGNGVNQWREIIPLFAFTPPSGEPTEWNWANVNTWLAERGYGKTRLGVPSNADVRPVDPPERVSEREVGCTCPIAWKSPYDPKCPAHGRVSEASATNEYRPWESMGITELAYWKQRYIEARQELGEASALRDELIEALGADDFSPGLDALAGTVRYHEIEEGRWGELNALYSTLVDIRRRALEDPKGKR